MWIQTYIYRELSKHLAKPGRGVIGWYALVSFGQIVQSLLRTDFFPNDSSFITTNLTMTTINQKEIRIRQFVH